MEILKKLKLSCDVIIPISSAVSGNFASFNEYGDIVDSSASISSFVPVVNGKVPESYLPSYVDDVIELITISDTPPASANVGEKYYNSTEKLIYTWIQTTEGKSWSNAASPEKGKIYVAIDTNKSYRWSGSELILIGGGDVQWNDIKNKPTTIAGYGISDACVSADGTLSCVSITLGNVTLSAERKFSHLLSAVNSSSETMTLEELTDEFITLVKILKGEELESYQYETSTDKLTVQGENLSEDNLRVNGILDEQGNLYKTASII